jgi:hypothetical protein
MLSAVWVLTKEVAFVQYLSDHISEAGDNGSFKKHTFERAAAHITPYHEHRLVKAAKSCKNKYSAVSNGFVVLSQQFMLMMALIAAQGLLDHYANQGCLWLDLV